MLNLKPYRLSRDFNLQHLEFTESYVKNKQKINELVSGSSVSEHVLVQADS